MEQVKAGFLSDFQIYLCRIFRFAIVIEISNYEQVKSFDSERRKLESRIEKLTKQIAVLEKAVEDNRSVKDDGHDDDGVSDQEDHLSLD